MKRRNVRNAEQKDKKNFIARKSKVLRGFRIMKITISILRKKGKNEKLIVIYSKFNKIHHLHYRKKFHQLFITIMTSINC